MVFKYYKKLKKNWNRGKQHRGESLIQKVGRIGQKVAYIGGMVNAEKQYKDINASQSPTFNGSITCLSAIAQGDDVGGRTGNSILAKSLFVNFSIGINASATQTMVRCLIFIDMLNTGTATTATELLTSAYVGNGYAPLAPLNVDFTTRYRVLVDKKYTLSNQGTKMLAVKVYKKLHKHVKYTGSASTDVYKNNIYMLLISDENANAPLVNWVSRLGYYDN